jgi:hypothetical protein
MASLSPSTGRDDGFINLNISGNYQYCNSGGTRCAASNGTRVYNQQISRSGTLDLVEGDFTSVGGVPRQQIFMLNLNGATAAVTGWTSAEFNEHCWFSEPFYLRAASWSPDDSTVYTATTGFHLFNWNGSFPLTGLCDTAGAFPATQTSVSDKWLNFTGCDSPPRLPTPPPHISAGIRAGRRTPMAAIPGAPAASQLPAWKACPRHPGCSHSTRPGPAAKAPTTC